MVLADALHSVRSPLCIATNETPHERVFNFKRRSTFGTSVPTWLCAPGPVLLRRHVRTSKYDSLVDKVHLLHAAPNYAIVRMPNGRETTVSLKDVAPYVADTSANESPVEIDEHFSENCNNTFDTSQKESENSFPGVLHDVNDNVDTIEVSNEPVQNVPHLSRSEPSINNSAEGLRRSTRVRKAVDRYGAVPYV